MYKTVQMDKTDLYGYANQPSKGGSKGCMEDTVRNV
jgi:hypothetical protein